MLCARLYVSPCSPLYRTCLVAYLLCIYVSLLLFSWFSFMCKHSASLKIQTNKYVHVMKKILFIICLSTNKIRPFYAHLTEQLQWKRFILHSTSHSHFCVFTKINLIYSHQMNYAIYFIRNICYILITYTYECLFVCVWCYSLIHTYTKEF